MKLEKLTQEQEDLILTTRKKWIDRFNNMVKSTPIDINPLHYDFYKSDDFSIEKIITHQIISLSDV